MATIIFPAFSLPAPTAAPPTPRRPRNAGRRALRPAHAPAQCRARRRSSTRRISSHISRLSTQGQTRQPNPGSDADPCIAGEHPRCIGLDRDTSEPRLARLEHFADAVSVAAGADSRKSECRPAIVSHPDLLCCRATMHRRIGRVLELLRHEVARRVRGDEFLRPLHRAERALGRRRESEFRAERANHRASVPWLMGLRA